MTFKNIKIKMKGGKSRMQRVKVLASGKYKFVKNLTKSRAGSKPAAKKRRKGRNPRPKEKARKVKKMAKKRRRRRNGITFPLAAVGGLVGTLSVKGASGGSVIDAVMTGDIGLISYELREKLTGVDADGNFHIGWLMESYAPLIIGCLVHKFVGGRPLNVNRMLAAANIPFVRI